MKAETCHPDAHHAIRTAYARSGRTPCRPAFTLVELIVSIGILGLMMAMVGTVFKLTIDSTGEATSLVEVTQSMRLLEETLRKDLAQIPQNPGQTMSGSMMVIQANPINAYWRTEYIELDDDADPSTGYLHDPDPERETTDLDPANRPIPALPRADVLMFFTSASGSESFRSYPYPAIEAKMAQVVYGHAELGRLQSDGAWAGGNAPADFVTYSAAPPGAVFPDAAETWHLARRTVLLVDQSEADLDPYVPDGTAGKKTPGMLDDTFNDDGDRSYSSEPLQDGVIDVVDNDSAPDPSFDYDVEVSARATLPAGFAVWFARPRLDPTPPALQARRLGAYLLPHCASFKVEWGLDLRDPAFEIPFGANPGQLDSAPQELVWLDAALDPGPGQPLVELAALAQRFDDAGALPDIGARLRTLGVTIAGRFTGAPAGINRQTPVWFGNDRPNDSGSGSLDEPDRYFPKAVRITVDVYDDSGRFTRPTRHVMVLPVGSG